MKKVKITLEELVEQLKDSMLNRNAIDWDNGKIYIYTFRHELLEFAPKDMEIFRHEPK